MPASTFWNIQSLEWLLLSIVVFGRILLLIRYFNAGIGYDVAAHIDVVSMIRWTDMDVDFWKYYYAYHPPLGFLLAHSLTLAGWPVIGSTQVVACISGIIGFWFLRLIVRDVGHLHSARGLLFLYGCAALPLSVYLSVTVNLDVIVFAAACGAIWTCMQLFKTHHTLWSYLFWMYCVVSILVIGIFTKHSGIVLLCVPFLTALLGKKSSRKNNLLFALAAVVSACVICLPYYYNRNYVKTGEWLFNTADHYFMINETRYARMFRDMRPLRTAVNTLLPVYNWTDGKWDKPMIRGAWNSLFWMEDRGPQTRVGPIFGTIYRFWTPLFLFFGIIGIIRGRKNDPWRRFGLLVISLASIYILLLATFMYRFPLAPYFSGKGIYIAPALLAVCYLISEGLYFCATLLPKSWKNPLQWCGLGLLTLILLVNTLLPVF